MQKKERVLVAMSGGVDSSVAAYLLLKQEYEVIGVTFQLYDYSRLNRKQGKGGCCSLEDVADARAVCDKLGIRHYLFDARDRFKNKVLDYFSSSYKQGKTPNPCVACNTFIKFDELELYAEAVEAPWIATGHYVRVVKEINRAYLEVAKDLQKDQSYFLMGVSSDKLRKCLFPMGDYTKEEVRRMAKEADLPVSQKPDSMEICFIPDNNYRNFLKEERHLPDDPGEIVNESGEVIGQHLGIHHFTIGQHKGLPQQSSRTEQSRTEQSRTEANQYVIHMDPEKKQVVVGSSQALLSQGLCFEATRFPEVEKWEGRSLKVKIRSRSPFISATIIKKEDQKAWVRFDEPQRAVTPGQFAVFYLENKLLGGGSILESVAHF